MRSRLVMAFAFVLAIAPAVPASGTSGWSVETIASGLDNPRGVSIGASGVVYVAESGSGGSTFVADGAFGGQPGPGCVGDTGGVTRIVNGVAERIASLPSAAPAFDPDGPGGAPPTCDGPVGFASVGPSHVLERSNGRVDVVMGLGGNTDVRDAFGEQFGTIVTLFPRGGTAITADLAGFEQASDPDLEGPDSNPYGIEGIAPGRFVADAGANALFHVRPSGSTSTVATFPRLAPVPFPALSCIDDLPPGVFPPPGTPIPPQSVPTSVALGPDGYLYVGLLTGFPFGVGTAQVLQVNPATGDVTVFADGLTHITGLDVDADGNVYVAQITDDNLLELEVCGGDTPGSIIKIHTDGGRETIGQFPLVGDVAVDDNGDVYVTYGSILPAFAGGGALAKLTYGD